MSNESPVPSVTIRYTIIEPTTQGITGSPLSIYHIGRQSGSIHRAPTIPLIYSRKESTMPGEVIPPAALNLRSATILIVEDDADIGEFLQQLIEEETPYHTKVIGDGLSALEQAQRIHPCLLLL